MKFSRLPLDTILVVKDTQWLKKSRPSTANSITHIRVIIM